MSSSIEQPVRRAKSLGDLRREAKEREERGEPAPVQKPAEIVPINKTSEDARIGSRILLIENAADIERREVDWLWEYRIARGRINLLVGLPDAGKGWVSMAISTAVISGTRLPSDLREPDQPGRVLWAEYEDDPNDTLTPRLDLSGGTAHQHLFDVIRGTITEDGSRVPFGVQDVPFLERVINERGDVKLLVISPLMSFIGGKVDAHRENEVRAALMPLQDMASRTGVTVLAIMHFRKQDADTILNRISGSAGFGQVVRSVLVVAKDSETKRRAVGLTKHNLAPDDLPSIEFEMRWPNGMFWVGESDLDPDQMLRVDARRDSPTRDDAQAELKAYLADGRPVDAKDAGEWVMGKTGCGLTTVKDAARRLNVHKEPVRKEGRIVGWLWSLTRDATQTDRL